jgi:O-antigen biosynthesis protein WbqP
MKRIFDVFLSIFLLALLSVPSFVIAVMVKLSSRGPVLYWSDRIGINNEIFKMPKFRTMQIKTPEIASHLLERSDDYLTLIGSFLRKTSIDELPQVWSVLKGDMSFVGPRPALFNQEDLIALRTGKGVHQLIPGITGWAQINGRDDIPIPVKVEYDEFYLKNQSFFFDLNILWKTFFKVIKREGVAH